MNLFGILKSVSHEQPNVLLKDPKGIGKSTIVGIVLILIVVAIGYTFLFGGEETKQVKISHLRIYSEKPSGYMENQGENNTSFKIGKKIWIYSDINNFGTVERKGKTTIWIKNQILLKKNGKIVKEMKTISNLSPVKKEKIDELYLTRPIATENLSSGNYILKLIVWDKITGKKDTRTYRFKLTR